jgi:hypothetical protein
MNHNHYSLPTIIVTNPENPYEDPEPQLHGNLSRWFWKSEWAYLFFATTELPSPNPGLHQKSSTKHNRPSAFRQLPPVVQSNIHDACQNLRLILVENPPGLQ